MKSLTLTETSVKRGASWPKWRFPHAAALIGALMICASPSLPASDEEMKMPEPVKQHQWLDRFVGEWSCEGECLVDPEKPMKLTGGEHAKRLGKFWVISKGMGKMGDMEMQRVFTIGFDTHKNKFVATWVDSMGDTLWTYEGTLSDDGNVLTLNTEGYCPMHKKVMTFKEVIEFKSADEKVFTSYVKGEDGQWTKMLSVTSTRKPMDKGKPGA